MKLCLFLWKFALAEQCLSCPDWRLFISAQISPSLMLRKQTKCSISVRWNSKTTDLDLLPYWWSYRTKCSVKASPMLFGNLAGLLEGIQSLKTTGGNPEDHEYLQFTQIEIACQVIWQGFKIRTQVKRICRK